MPDMDIPHEYRVRNGKHNWDYFNEALVPVLDFVNEDSKSNRTVINHFALEREILYSIESPDIKISMEVSFNAKGQLVFDGYDIGKTVNDFFGEPDYEYHYTIEPEEVNKFYALYKIESGDRSGLLKVLKDRFGHDKAYSAMGIFMKEHGIHYASFIWP